MRPAIGDVWGAIIAELPEGPARDAAIVRRALGIERYGVPLGMRDLETARQDLAEEMLDAAAYGVETAAILAAQRGEAEQVDLLTYDAAEHLRRATDGEHDVRIGFAIGRAVRKLATLKRGGA